MNEGRLAEVLRTLDPTQEISDEQLLSLVPETRLMNKIHAGIRALPSDHDIDLDATPDHPRRRRRLVMKVGLPAILVASLVGVAISSEASPPPPPPNANITPPQLPASAGLDPSLTGWTLVSSGSSPIWLGKGYSPVDSRTLGLNGGLLQFWVSTAAADQYGTGQDLPLPIPISFASAHLGPIEATLQVLSFSKPNSAQQLLDNSLFSQIGEGNSDILVIQGGGINGGHAVQISSDANGGLTEYEFQWTSGASWYSVAVLGAGMSFSQAQAFAEHVGTPQGS